MANTKKDVWLTNVPALAGDTFQPATGLGAGWVPVDYELDDFAGVALATGAYSPAEPLALTLGLTGWHRLHVAHNPAVRIWLEGEAGYREVPGDLSTIRDTEALCADFTDRRICIAPVHGQDRAHPLTLFYFRAEPCDGPPRQHCNLVATNDGHGVCCQGLDTARDLYRWLYPFRDSDFFRVLWGVYGGGPLTLRPDSPFPDLDARLEEDGLYSVGDAVFARSLRRLRAAGVDPLAVVREATREYGLDLHYYFRMSAFYGPFPHLNWNTRFFREHPEWHCRDEHGNAVQLLSYAFPEVQDYVLSFFEELLEYDPDGICLAFNRGLPLMICEAPVIEAFRQRHGRAPRLPEEVNAPELDRVRHELLAGFVERVRQRTAAHGKALSCIVPREFERNLRLGLDIGLLAERGLFESVMVGAGHGDDLSLATELGPVTALKGRSPNTRIFCGGSKSPGHGAAWRCDSPEQARRMSAILDAGLDGGFVWDAEVEGPDWNLWKRFGDREVLDRVMRGQVLEARAHATRRIHDLAVGRYNPWHAY